MSPASYIYIDHKIRNLRNHDDKGSCLLFPGNIDHKPRNPRNQYDKGWYHVTCFQIILIDHKIRNQRNKKTKDHIMSPASYIYIHHKIRNQRNHYDKGSYKHVATQWSAVCLSVLEKMNKQIMFLIEH